MKVRSSGASVVCGGARGGAAGRAVVIAVALVCAALQERSTATQSGGNVTLGLTLSDTAISPGETLTVRVRVDNPAGGPLADFVFALLLPDGSTMVSAGPSIGARFGRFGDLRTLVPVARNISLGSAFQYENNAFFSYTFAGSEPNGTYRVYFATLRSGTLDDGVIGAGELLALETAAFVVAPGVTTTIDPAHTVTAAIPPEGGSVATTGANGIEYHLAFPPGALAVAKAISITPLVAATNLPGNGTFALGLRLEPSGLSFPQPVTLTMTLPASATVNPQGYSAIVSSDEGRSAQAIPVLVEGRTLTVTVAHFSDEIVIDSAFSFCAKPVTAEMGEACSILGRAFEVFGGFDTPGFKPFAEEALGDWFTTGMLPRVGLAEVGTLPAGVDREKLLDAVYVEALAWLSMYQAAFGKIQIGNESRPLADAGESLFLGLGFATTAALDRADAKCLADKSKANVAEQIERATKLTWNWITAFEQALLSPSEYCLDLSIDAAPPPVLTLGTPTNVPLAIVAKFTDGGELPGVQVLLTMTATDARMEPAGGLTTLPVFGPATITPSALSSTVTITGEFTEPGFHLLPARTRSFPAGAPTGLAVTSSVLFAVSGANLPGVGAPHQPVVTDSKRTFEPTQSVSAELKDIHVAGGWTYNASATSTATRSVTIEGDQITIAGTGSKTAGLTATGGTTGFPEGGAAAGGGNGDTICFDLPKRHTATYNVTSNAAGPRRAGASADTVILSVGSDTEISAPGGGNTANGTVSLEAGNRCVNLFVGGWGCSVFNSLTVRCDVPASLEWSYTVALRPAP